MPSADWTSISNGSGAFAIIADGTAPSGPDVMLISAGGQMFQNITAGTFRDSRITAWNKQATANNSPLYLVLRSLNTTYSANPASYFMCEILAESAAPDNINFIIRAVVAGVSTTIVTGSASSLNGNPVNTWQQFQFSSFNSGVDILLRLSQWTGAAFAPIVDCAAPIASFGALNAVGSCRFGALISGGANTVRIDDVAYYSLT